MRSSRCSTASTTYPDVGIAADDPLQPPRRVPRQRTTDGNYIEDASAHLAVAPETPEARHGRAGLARGWISVENQSPIIKGINDDPDALRIMQRALNRVGCREPLLLLRPRHRGHRAFNVPIETAWKILNESQKGLSGVENARASVDHPLQGQDRGRGGHQRADSRCSRAPRTVSSSSRSCATRPVRPIAARSASSAATRTRSGLTTTNDRVIFDEAGLYALHGGFQAQSVELPLVAEAVASS